MPRLRLSARMPRHVRRQASRHSSSGKDAEEKRHQGARPSAPRTRRQCTPQCRVVHNIRPIPYPDVSHEKGQSDENTLFRAIHLAVQHASPAIQTQVAAKICTQTRRHFRIASADTDDDAGFPWTPPLLQLACASLMLEPEWQRDGMLQSMIHANRTKDPGAAKLFPQLPDLAGGTWDTLAYRQRVMDVVGDPITYPHWPLAFFILLVEQLLCMRIVVLKVSPCAEHHVLWTSYTTHEHEFTPTTVLALWCRSGESQQGDYFLALRERRVPGDPSEQLACCYPATSVPTWLRPR